MWLYIDMKINLSIELDEILKKPVDDWDEEDMEEMEDEKEDLPRNEVKLPKDEAMMHPGSNAKPIKHTVVKGETLKDIAKKYEVSYGELSNHLMNTEGTTSIHEGMEIQIPRHFQDLTEAM